MYVYIILSILILGLYFVIHPSNQDGFEGNRMHYRCPDILIQKGSEYYLYNSKVAKVPGVNPVTFHSLHDYTEFIEWQRSKGMRCPVLYLQHSYNTQGNSVYKAHSDPENIHGGLQDYYPSESNKLIDAGRDNPIFNKGVPAYDPDNQYIGNETPLDKMFHDGNKVSVNPMDTNWGGQEYTSSFIDKTKDTRTTSHSYKPTIVKKQRP